MIKTEVEIFFTALRFFTRVPCPRWVPHSQEHLNKSSRYFPLIGILVGGMGALVYLFASTIFPHVLAILLSMVATILLTGGFHEDGLADFFDGFGGGWTKEKILEIMKDSRLGTFGLLGLLSILALKCATLYSIPSSFLPIVIICAHALSRMSVIILMYTMEYVRDDLSSKVKPLAVNISPSSLGIGVLGGLSPLLFSSHYFVFILIVPVLLTTWYLSRFFKKWIGGYTGDCLGATQQITEVIYYLGFLTLCKFF